MKGSTFLLLAIISTAVLTQAPVASAKVAVKAPAVKVAVAAPAVKASVTPKVKVSIAAPKVKAAAGAKAVVGAKVTGGLSVNIGGASLKIGASTGASSSAVNLTGSCPQAANFGLGAAVPPAANKAAFCTTMTSSCCSAVAVKAYGDSLVTRAKSISGWMWNVAKIQTAAMTLLTGLKSDFGNTAAQGAAPKPATATVAVPKVSLKVSAKPKVAVAVVAPAVKVSVPKVKLGVSTKVSAGVRRRMQVAVKATVPKVAVKAKVAAPAKVAAVAKVAGTVKVAPVAKVSGSVKVALPKVAVATTAKKTVKITVKVGGSVGGSEKPSTWIGSRKGKAQFTAAFNFMYLNQGKRGSYFNYAQNCFKEVMSLRSNLFCAVCDNTSAKFMGTTVALQPTDVDDIQNQCAPWLKSFATVNTVMWYMMKYVDTVSNKPTTAANLNALSSYKPLDVNACFSSAPAAKATVKVTVKAPAAKAAVVAPKVSVKVGVPKVAVKAAVKARILQAVVKPAAKPAAVVVKPAAKPAVVVVKPAAAAAAKTTALPTTITQDSWTNWKGGFEQDPVVDTVSPSPACLKTQGMTQIVTDLIFGYKSGSKDAEVVNFRKQTVTWWNALECMYAEAAGATAAAAWKSFKGASNAITLTAVLGGTAADILKWRAVTSPVSASPATAKTVVVKPAAAAAVKPAAAAADADDDDDAARRMQAVVKPAAKPAAVVVKPAAKPAVVVVKPAAPGKTVAGPAKTLTEDAKGLTLTDNKKYSSGLTVVTLLAPLAGQTEMQAANLMKVFTLAFLALLFLN